MQPLSPDDLLPLEEFATRRSEFFAAHARYLDRYRRVRVGPKVTLVFENRQTLWFRVQELLRVVRLADPLRVQRELHWYNRLLPARNRLQAALLLAIPDGPGLAEELRFWRGLWNDAVWLRVESLAVPGRVLTARPEDGAIGAAHWVEFELNAEARQAFADLRRPARFEVRHGDYRHESSVLNEEVRQSLLDDLALSDRDA